MISKKPFRMHLYKLHTGEKSQNLEQVIRQVIATPLNIRMRKLGSQEYRLEEALPPTTDEPYWILDFTKFRYDGGPGKGSESTPVESFMMQGGFGFAEDTAMLYDPKNGWLVIQYNHYGPRSQAISDYLSVFDIRTISEFNFQLQLNLGACARLHDKKIFTKLRIKVAPDRLSKEYRNANMSLVSALEAQIETFGGDVVTIEVGLDRDNKNSLNLQKWIPSFLRMAAEEGEAVSSLTISGKDDFEYPIDPVDLIKERLETVIKDLKLDDGLRYAHIDRYNALKRAYNGWAAEGVIIK